MAWKWYDSKVIDIKEASPNTKRFWLQTEEQIEFIPGQFVTMDLPISDKRLKRWRSYSIVNYPNGSNILEFCIVNLDGGSASKYFFTDVVLGTPIKFKGPSGTFTLPSKIEDDLILICTGTGVAPYRSMIQYLAQHPEVTRKHIHLIFGTRYENGILYREEFEKLSEEDWFSYDIVLSRDTNWQGYKGYVHDVYMSKYKNNTDGKRFFLCGWTPMIDEAVANLLLKMKVEKSKIHYELYG